MRSYILLLVGFLFIQNAYTQDVEYTYDDGGNRIQRKVLVLRNKNDQNVVTSKNDILHDQAGNYQFSLFPNPTEGWVSVDADSSFMELFGRTLKVFDNTGRMLQESDFTTSLQTIDLSKQEPGYYIVKLSAANGFSREWKVIKK